MPSGRTAAEESGKRQNQLVKLTANSIVPITKWFQAAARRRIPPTKRSSMAPVVPAMMPISVPTPSSHNDTLAQKSSMNHRYAKSLASPHISKAIGKVTSMGCKGCRLMATTVPVPLGKGVASFSMTCPYTLAANASKAQQCPCPRPPLSRLWRTANPVFLLLLPALQACSGKLSALDPAGPAARSIAHIWNVMAWSSAIIVFFMLVLAAYACVRRPRADEPSYAGRFMLGGGLLFPAVVLLALLIYGLRTGDAQSPVPGEEGVYRIEVRAHQWWWEINHLDAPGGPAVARNEINAPAGRPLIISVTAEDVIHSFWIPRLGGKIDAIPGRVNTIRLIADQPGVYHGVCAEFCGTGHAAMSMKLRAHHDADLESVFADLSLERRTGNE